MYDHEINMTYTSLMSVSEHNSQFLIASYKDSVFYKTLVINIEKGFATYSVSPIDGSYKGQYSEGKCYKQ